MRWDVAIVGGGPAGLACAIEAASRGLSTIVLERRAIPHDKACGEGLLPSGRAALEALGAAELVAREDRAELRALRFVDPGGAVAEAALPAPYGLAVRRTALADALARRAVAAGARLDPRAEVIGVDRGARAARIVGRGFVIEAALVVAADGVASPTRLAAGLSASRAPPRRFGARRHVAMRPWSAAVEIHFGDGLEAYVTPAGVDRVGVALLWDAARLGPGASFEALLARFPSIADRVAGAPADSVVRGAPLRSGRARAVVLDRLALVGDAAGSVDALTGEGISLALASARSLGALLPHAVAAGATASALAPYARRFAREYARRAAVERALLYLAAHPPLRARVLAVLGDRPRVLARLVALAVS